MISHDLQLAAARLNQGDVVAIPTETVYGLGAAIRFPKAVAQVYEMKRRPLDHPLIVHVASLAEAERLTTGFPSPARKLVEKFWPGPLTLVLPKSHLVPDIVSGGLSSVAIRIPAHPTALELLQKVGPVAAPSANAFGEISPTTAQHVVDSFPGYPDLMVVDGGAAGVGLESTIISFLQSEPVCLRPGGLPLEDLEATGLKILMAAKNAKAIAPGMLPKHYSPHTPLRFWEAGADLPPAPERLGILYFQTSPPIKAKHKVGLSNDGDLRMAATRLYAGLRSLDDEDVDEIWAFSAPDHGLGRAINDRLKRAACP